MVAFRSFARMSILLVGVLCGLTSATAQLAGIFNPRAGGAVIAEDAGAAGARGLSRGVGTGATSFAETQLSTSGRLANGMTEAEFVSARGAGTLATTELRAGATTVPQVFERPASSSSLVEFRPSRQMQSTEDAFAKQRATTKFQQEQAQTQERWQAKQLADQEAFAKKQADQQSFAKGQAENTAQYQKLKEIYRQNQKYGNADTKVLENGRYRFYGETLPPTKAGEMRGSRLVREFDPTTGNTRTWYETLDQNGVVRSVAPKPVIREDNHFIFDSNGNYIGKR